MDFVPQPGEWIYYLKTCSTIVPAHVLEVEPNELTIVDMEDGKTKKVSRVIGMWPITSVLELMACEAAWANRD